jgi:hypothetical protein
MNICKLFNLFFFFVIQHNFTLFTRTFFPLARYEKRSINSDLSYFVLINHGLLRILHGLVFLMLNLGLNIEYA